MRRTRTTRGGRAVLRGRTRTGRAKMGRTTGRTRRLTGTRRWPTTFALCPRPRCSCRLCACRWTARGRCGRVPWRGTPRGRQTCRFLGGPRLWRKKGRRPWSTSSTRLSAHRTRRRRGRRARARGFGRGCRVERSGGTVPLFFYFYFVESNFERPILLE
ncbi:hypothetical protein DFJ74DRAFT_687483 [Hyaloraphidium curvatum]|nr:hypothetical protein DFJ74DRAFT_687483 [Hyaloraphidium curvatum]